MQIILCLNSEQWELMKVKFSIRPHYIGVAFESFNISVILRLYIVWVRIPCHKWINVDTVNGSKIYKTYFQFFYSYFLFCILLPSYHIFIGCDVETTRLLVMLPGLAGYSF